MERTVRQHLLELFQRQRADQQHQLDLLRSGTLRSLLNNVDTTADSIARSERVIADLDEVLSRVQEARTGA